MLPGKKPDIPHVFDARSFVPEGDLHPARRIDQISGEEVVAFALFRLDLDLHADLAVQLALIYEEEFEKNNIASYARDERISLGENPGGEIPYVSTGTDEISAGTPGTATLHVGESRQPGASRAPSEL